LQFNAGVSNQLVLKGGSIIQEQAHEIIKDQKQIPTGCVAITGAGQLKFKHIIHAVGPNFKDPS
jgi:O-acetyl-ADP-ribose deacetylase (regulator of RNase III)